MGHNEIDAGQISYAADQHRSKPAQEQWFQVNQPVWVRAPLWPHVRQAKLCLRVCQVVFLGVLPLSPHLLIGPSHMS